MNPAPCYACGEIPILYYTQLASFPVDLSDFFDEMALALQDHDFEHLEMIGFGGCAKSAMASLALSLCAALGFPSSSSPKYHTQQALDRNTWRGLCVAARYIKDGAVKFPRAGCEQLITQLLGFGIEKA